MSRVPGGGHVHPSPPNEVSPLTVNAIRHRKRTRVVRLAGIVAGVVALLAFALVALVCYKTGLQPGEILWLDREPARRLVMTSLDESRHEVIALGVAALNLGWLLVHLHLNPGRSRPSTAVGGSGEGGSAAAGALAQALADQEVVGEGTNGTPEVDVTAGDSPGPVESPCRNDEAQLQIATSELSRLRRELSTTRAQLEAANGARSQFLANMSHELRTPLNGIIGMTDLLLGGELPARERRFAQSMAVTSNALLGIISDLLDFSNIESGTLNLERSRFRVRDAVEDVCSMLAERAHEKDIELMCYVDDNVPVLADGDASRLRQVIDNLVRNAIAFTDEGEVVVRLSRVESTASRSVYRCDVQDTGSGISPEMQMRMFEAFTQEDGSSTRRHGGLGMGLAIVRELVALMGGEITFRSRLGEGTRFGFTLPLDDAEDEAGDDEARRDIRGARVLVVDDNETNRTILYHQLSGWGVVVDTVDGGEAALARLYAAADRGAAYDLLVLDLHMPGMDGLELARRIRDEPAFAGVRSLMLTSAVLELDDQALAALGIDRYVSKPPRQSVLHESLVSLLPAGGMVEPLRELAAAVVPTGTRVLLADDNIVSQDVGVGLLECAGCRVDVVSDGREALVRAEAETYDMILMDCRMPGLDGYAATASIRAGAGPNVDTPIVALTASAMQGDRERCLEAGMSDYLAKPVRLGDLNEQLQRWVSGDVPGSATLPLRVSATAAAAHPDSTSGATLPERIDQAAIDAIRALQRPGKPDLLGKVMGTFLKRTPVAIAAMHAAIEANDGRALFEQMHTLRASSAYVGAACLSERCRRAEAAAEAGDMVVAATLVIEVDAEYRAAAEELGAYARAA